MSTTNKANTLRLDKDREIDVLAVGERVLCYDAPLLCEVVVTKVEPDFVYSDGSRRPLGYKVDRMRPSGQTNKFASRSELFRQTPGELAELRDRVERDQEALSWALADVEAMQHKLTDEAEDEVEVQ